MTIFAVTGYLPILCYFAINLKGVLTQDPRSTTAPPSYEGSWYVIPAIVWSSAASFLLLILVMLSCCFFRSRRLTENRHTRFYNLQEKNEKIRNKKRTKASRRSSQRSKTSNSRSNGAHVEVRRSQTGSSVVVGPEVKVIGADNHSHRTVVESELFNISKINPVYECEKEDELYSKHIISESMRNIYMYEPSEGVQIRPRDSIHDLSRGPSFRGSSAASFSGLPAPSMTATGSNVVRVKAGWAKVNDQQVSVQIESPEPSRDQSLGNQSSAASVEQQPARVIITPSTVDDSYIMPILDQETHVKTIRKTSVSNADGERQDILLEGDSFEDAKCTGCGVGRKLESYIRYHPRKTL